MLKQRESSFLLHCPVTLMQGNARQLGGVGEEALLTSPYATGNATLTYSRAAHQIQPQHLMSKLLYFRSLVMNVKVTLIQSSPMSCVI